MDHFEEIKTLISKLLPQFRWVKTDLPEGKDVPTLKFTRSKLIVVVHTAFIF